MPITIRKIELFCSLLFFSPTCQKCLFFSQFFPKIRHFETGLNCDVLTLKRTSFSTIFRRRSVESSSDNFRFFPINTVSCDIYRKNSKSIWQQCHVGSNPTVCAKDSTLRGAAFYFCGKLCKGCKVGFEQPVSGALRPAGQKLPRWGIFRARVLYFSRTVIREH